MSAKVTKGDLLEGDLVYQCAVYTSLQHLVYQHQLYIDVLSTSEKNRWILQPNGPVKHRIARCHGYQSVRCDPWVYKWRMALSKARLQAGTSGLSLWKTKGPLQSDVGRSNLL